MLLLHQTANANDYTPIIIPTSIMTSLRPPCVEEPSFTKAFTICSPLFRPHRPRACSGAQSRGLKAWLGRDTRICPPVTIHLRGLLHLSPRPRPVPRSQRRPGGSARTWFPSLWASCACSHRRTFPVSFHPLYSHLVHASDADQAEALLTRWGPDGLGKLGGEILKTCQTSSPPNAHPHSARSTLGQSHQGQSTRE